jgi:alkylation response protein AidB-like acyl-CoA dehydrogenase
MQAALDVTVPYVHERKQFGVHIGEFQVRKTQKCFVTLIENKYLPFEIIYVAYARKIS